MDVGAGHSAAEAFAAFNSGRLNEGDEILLDRAEIAELLIEMPGQQHDGVFEFALAAVQRAVPELTGHDRGSGRDDRDQEQAANHEPADRPAPGGSPHVDGSACICHREVRRR